MSTSSASPTRPFLASQRGLSGMVKSSTKNSTAGSAAMPIFQRHSASPNPMVPITKFEKYATRIPKTMLNWKKPTSRPRNLGGAISAMYMGPSTEEAPIPNPPMKRAPTNEYQSKANAQPSAEIK